MENRQLIQNALETPDGTILTSGHVHDFRTHEDTVTNQLFMVDGGLEYVRRNMVIPKEDLTLYSDDIFEIIREKLLRGGRGKGGREKLKYVKLRDINDEELNRPDNYYLKFYRQEKKFREENNITIS